MPSVQSPFASACAELFKRFFECVSSQLKEKVPRGSMADIPTSNIRSPSPDPSKKGQRQRTFADANSVGSTPAASRPNTAPEANGSDAPAAPAAAGSSSTAAAPSQNGNAAAPATAVAPAAHDSAAPATAAEPAHHEAAAEHTAASS